MNNNSESVGSVYIVPHVNFLKLGAVRKAEGLAHEKMTRGFRHVIDAGQRRFADGKAYLLTTQLKKIEGAQHIVDNRAAGVLQVAQAPIPTFIEVKTPSAREAALQKAQYGKRFTEERYGTHQTFLGGDTVHWVRVRADAQHRTKAAFVQKHKLARNTNPDTQEQLATRLTKQKWHYSQPGVENLDIYENALAIVNGVQSVASTWIYIWSKPFDPEQMQAYINQSLETNTYYASNSRGALFEALCSYQLLTGLALIPEEYFLLEGENADIRPWIQEPTPILQAAVQRSIHTTTPSVVLGMRRRNVPRSLVAARRNST